MDAAKAVIDDKEATEEQVKKAHDDLQKALFELRLNQRSREDGSERIYIRERKSV